MKLTKQDIDKVRHIEGFPIARDEDIIALSRPPYYTACPNPFIEDFIRENGTPYDESTDNYHREPFAHDVIDSKYDPVYQFHPYHTKVPYKSIAKYVEHYTDEGAIILDAFSGSGMTGMGVAIANNMRRNVVLSDLSPFASFITGITNSFGTCSLELVEKIQKAIQIVEDETAWMFETNHGGEESLVGPVRGRINFVVWSDVFVCPSCAKEYVFWDEAVDIKKGKIASKYHCPHCSAEITKNESTRAYSTIYDAHLGTSVTMGKQVPVLINYSVGKKRYEKIPDASDMALIEKIEGAEIPYWYPVDELPAGDNTSQPKESHHIDHVYQFYTRRNLWVLASLYDKLTDVRCRFIITKVAFRITKRYGLTYQSGSWGAGGGPTNGTLYIPSLNKELNIVKQLTEAVADISRNAFPAHTGNAIVSTQSTTDLRNIPSNSIDYIYTDPPFGGNLNYSELNFIWESWLKVHTNNKTEAIINGTQKKALLDYHTLIAQCIREYARVLKPNRWITVVFHNSSSAVWNALQESIGQAGLIVADIRVMDKGKMSSKQITSRAAVKQDLVISAYKPTESFVREFQEHAGDPEMAWKFVRQHLANVPIVADGNRDGKLDIITERQDYLLFDRMVAWHIMNGIPVPLDAHAFYEGLRQRFLQRDGMFFLPDQVNEYDEKRAHMELDVQQLSFVVTDEKNAIAWLNYILRDGPKTYQEIQPAYLQELHQSKQEKMPELLDMLRENFVQDEKGAWYVPDLSNAADLAKVRRKALLKEFYDSCVPGKAKLKVFRMEAIRAGFDECWKARDFKTIVAVGEKLPEAVLQEDPALLMYYDNACARV